MTTEDIVGAYILVIDALSYKPLSILPLSSFFIPRLRDGEVATGTIGFYVKVAACVLIRSLLGFDWNPKMLPRC